MILDLKPTTAAEFFAELAKQVKTLTPEERRELRDDILADMLRSMPVSEVVQ
jgi:hypothetical protein